MITSEQITQVVEKIVKNVQPVKVILFGSYASGLANENSDLDLLIVKNTGAPANKRALEIRRHLRGMKIPMDIIVYTEEEIKEWKDIRGSLVYEVMEKGKVLHG